MENSLAFFEQLSTLRKVASFACKMSNFLDRSAVNLAFAHFGMSLFHDPYVVMRSFPGWINNRAEACLPDTRNGFSILRQNHWMIEKAMSFVKRDLKPPFEL